MRCGFPRTRNRRYLEHATFVEFAGRASRYLCAWRSRRRKPSVATPNHIANHRFCNFFGLHWLSRMSAGQASAASRFLVASPPVQDLSVCAKHLFVAAKLYGPALPQPPCGPDLTPRLTASYFLTPGSISSSASTSSYCVPKSPQSAPTVYNPANAQCPAGWFSSGAYACEKF